MVLVKNVIAQYKSTLICLTESEIMPLRMNPVLKLRSHSVVLNLALIYLMIFCMLRNINSLESPFNIYLVEEEPNFLRKVINLHPMFCGSPSCFVAWYGLSNLNPQCRPCSCRKNCRDFNTCCPSLILKEGFSKYSRKKASCIRPGIRPSNESRMFFLIDKCPGSTSPELKFNCEENNSLEAPFQTPVIGFNETAINHYKNYHCSRCHLVPDTNILNYSAILKCKDIYDIYSNSTSSTEVYNAAAHDEGCSIEFTAEQPEVCYVSDFENASLIQECNVTGQWVEYDAQVERGCLLHLYRIPFKEMYYNFFCYLCNINLGWVEINYQLYNPPANADKIIIPTQQVTLHNPFSDDSLSNQICYLLDDTNLCRNIFCSPLRKWHLTEKRCTSKFPTNAFGYESCIIFKTDIEDPRLAASFLYDEAYSVKEYLSKSGLHLAVVHLLNLEVWNCGRLTYFQQRLSVKVFTERNIDFMFMDEVLLGSAERRRIEPAEFCVNYRMSKQEKARCQIEVIEGTNTKFPQTTQGFEFSKGITYIRFTKLTFCCQIRLQSEEVLVDDNSNLIINNSQVVVPEGSYTFNTPKTEATVCVADFVKHPNISPCDEPRLMTERETVRSINDNENFNITLIDEQNIDDMSSGNRPMDIFIFAIVTLILIQF